MTNPCPLHHRVVSLVFGLRPLGGSSDLAQLIPSSNGTPSAALKSSCAAPEQPATCRLTAAVGIAHRDCSCKELRRPEQPELAYSCSMDCSQGLQL